ncbi:outer membrane lipoprotein carrier protein LolA [Paenibacillus aurantiacus]|uniref:Outer membrane lipoprotein carrier protein LolA n=1 Tax=Paenibacillus aurantiacus TaxID=1936118 RepID=A0ABV5KWI2_9BACL
MRRRISLLAAVLLCLTALLAACGGTKDADTVVKDLDKVVNSLDSYHGKGTMTLNTGQQPLEYQVDVQYQKPSYYRIELTNAKRDITQIVLRNDEGVFVLTPRLNKVFRFQSDWPQNQGQVYLYQTLVSSILQDNSRQFAVDKENYVFDVMANYQNGSLARQKIWLDKDYRPLQVEVSDTNAAVMVSVKFTEFDFDSKPDKSVFDTKQNLSGSSKPSTVQPEDGDAAAEGGKAQNGSADETTGNTPADSGKADDTEGSTSGDEPAEDTMAPVAGDQATKDNLAAALDPLYLGPEPMALQDSNDIVFGGLPGVMDRYAGATYDFTLIKTQPRDMAASSMGQGQMVDLVYTIGELIGDEESPQRTIVWTYDGIQYRLTSGTLPETELVRIAQSVQGEMTK